MNNRYFYFSVLLLSAALICTAAGDSGAHFEKTFFSARSVSLGGAFVGVADDPSAAVINPGGLARVSRTSFLTTYQKPYGLADLDEGCAAAAVPFKFGVFGLSWHHFGMRDVMSEDRVTLAFGRYLVHNSQDASLSVGASLDLARVSIEDPATSQNVWTCGLGVLLRPFPAIGFGYSVGNFRQGGFDLLEGGGKTDLNRTQAWGGALRWHNRVTFSLERKKGVGGEWKNHAGLEVNMAPNVRLRSGLGGRYAAAGVGFLWRGLSLDVSTASHEYLGSTYIVSLGYTATKQTGADETKP